ncbi:MAG: trigger factor [Fluviicola sp.]|nr:trigger factor [Fluviicola sp.]
MNVIREDVDALNAILKVQVAQEDYQSKVKASLEKYRKTAKIPGFRPGHVPMSMIQKQYGNSVLADTLNKVVNDSLYGFINENKIEILGNPIPKEGADSVKGDFNNPTEFEFAYEIGLTPKVEVELSAKNKYDYVKVKVDAELVNKQIDDLRRRYGKLVSSEKVGEKDLILAQFVELKEDGSVLEGGILNSSTISMEFVEDAATKKALTGKKQGDKVEIEPSKVSRGEKDTAAMLGITEDQLSSISSKFQMTINEIKHMEMADLSQELFDRLFGPGVINSEDELKTKIAEDLKVMFINDSDRILTRYIYDDLIAKTKVELPDTFLKRWIRLSNEKPILPEQIEAEYDGYAKSLKWQLIQGNIFKSNDIKLDNQELIEFTKGLLVSNYAQYGMPAPEDKELTENAMQVLSKKEEANRVMEMLADQKLIQFFKSTVKLNEKEVSYDEFVEIAKN